MSDELLQQMMGKLSSIESRIGRIEGTMATKDDIANMATKDDIANMATKDDISELHNKFDIMAVDLARMETKLDATFEQVAHLSELEITVKELAASVEENTTDIKLLKKLVTSH